MEPSSPQGVQWFLHKVVVVNAHNNKKWLVLFTLLFFALPSASAFFYNYGDNKTIYLYCVNATDGKLLGTQANLSVLNSSGTFYEVSALDNVGVGTFRHSLTNLSINGCYSLKMACKTAGTWESEWGTICEGEERDGMIIGALIFIPLILSIILIIASLGLDGEDHSALKIALFILSIVPFFASFHFAAISVARFYGFTDLIDAIGTTTYWIGMFFFVLIVYFLIYTFIKLVHAAAQKKKERLNY